MLKSPGMCGRKAGLVVVATAAVAGVVGLQLGFQKAAVPLKLPTGEWSGDGQYVYETWAKPGAAEAPTPISSFNRYPTRMSIKPATVDGHAVIEIDILSKHQETGVLKEDIHLRLALEEAKRPSDTALLYRIVHNEIGSSADDAIKVDAAAPPCGASLMREGDDLVLQIRYQPAYMDTIRFHGSTVEKSGGIGAEEDDDEQGFIHWVETLRAVK